MRKRGGGLRNTVVRSYPRLRFGKWESVEWHFRHTPPKLSYRESTDQLSFDFRS